MRINIRDEIERKGPDGLTDAERYKRYAGDGVRASKAWTGEELFAYRQTHDGKDPPGYAGPNAQPRIIRKPEPTITRGGAR